MTNLKSRVGPSRWWPATFHRRYIIIPEIRKISISHCLWQQEIFHQSRMRSTQLYMPKKGWGWYPVRLSCLLVSRRLLFGELWQIASMLGGKCIWRPLSRRQSERERISSFSRRLPNTDISRSGAAVSVNSVVTECRAVSHQEGISYKYRCVHDSALIKRYQ